MHVRSSGSLLSLSTQNKVIPVIENRAQLIHIFDLPRINAILLRHCNPLELNGLLVRAHERDILTYVNVDNIDGINADNAGIRYLAERLHITGIVSNHPRILALSKNYGLETIQRIYALDSTGLETALESVDQSNVDLLDISPALVTPHIMQQLTVPLPLPFIASGLILTSAHVRAVMHAGAIGVVVTRDELWS